MYSAKDDELRLLTLRGHAGEFKRITRQIGMADHIIALIVMAKNDQPLSQPGSRRRNPLVELGLSQVQIFVNHDQLSFFSYPGRFPSRRLNFTPVNDSSDLSLHDFPLNASYLVLYYLV